MTSLVDTEPMPARIAELPRDHRGYPIPHFVATIDGKPDFRIVRPGGIDYCIRGQVARCWVCGKAIHGNSCAYVVGPMCAVNRTSAEPPSHPSCARYSAKVCPFLTTPKMHRVESTLPEGHVKPAGIMLARNPGVALVWPTRLPIKVFGDGRGGMLFDLGQPSGPPEFYAQGRPATRQEVLASIDSGYPALHDLAEAEGPEAVRELGHMLADAMDLVPA